MYVPIVLVIVVVIVVAIVVVVGFLISGTVMATPLLAMSPHRYR